MNHRPTVLYSDWIATTIILYFLLRLSDVF